MPTQFVYCSYNSARRHTLVSKREQLAGKKRTGYKAPIADFVPNSNSAAIRHALPAERVPIARNLIFNRVNLTWKVIFLTRSGVILIRNGVFLVRIGAILIRHRVNLVGDRAFLIRNGVMLTSNWANLIRNRVTLMTMEANGTATGALVVGMGVFVFSLFGNVLGFFH